MPFATVVRTSLLTATACALLGLAVPPPDQMPETAPPSKSPPTEAATFAKPDRPLDARIKSDKITEVELPPLPQQIILPKPPVFELSSDAAQVPMNPDTWKAAQEAIDKGLAYLRSAQAKNGTWMNNVNSAPTDQPDKPTPIGLAVTAMAVKAFCQNDQAAIEDPRIRDAVRLLLNAQKPDGTFDDSGLSNYVNCTIISALASIKDNDYPDVVRRGVASLQLTQWDQNEGLDPKQDWFGGAGYGKNGRPDLSNTQMMLDALYDAGLSPEEPAFQKALAFVSRTQNLKQTNKANWAGDDGGFVYTPANAGESMSSEAVGEGRYGEKLPAGQPRSLRSYGSMTYAGFKSMIYAGLSQSDVRVRAAFDWLRNNWTFEENPGLGQKGLYYYYHTLSRALAIAQQDEITDIKGAKHNWRDELVTAILKRQREDGSWVNPAEERWNEGSAELVTIYCVLALEEVLKATR